MVNYANPEGAYREHINAYVGGDAYNYIINGTHATAFFVLTTMFALSAIGFLIVHYVSMADTRVENVTYGQEHSEEETFCTETNLPQKENL